MLSDTRFGEKNYIHNRDAVVHSNDTKSGYIVLDSSMERSFLKRSYGGKNRLAVILLSILLSGFSLLYFYEGPSASPGIKFNLPSSLFPHGSSLSSYSVGKEIEPRTPILSVPGQVKHNWGPYTPYHPVSEYIEVPSDCEIDQVNVLTRHGARTPTLSSTLAIIDALSKLKSVSDEYKDPKLEFLDNFDFHEEFSYDIDELSLLSKRKSFESGMLIPYGAAESFDAGQRHFSRYSGFLLSPEGLIEVSGINVNGAKKRTKDIPFVRASSGQRVVESALNWTAGFAYASRSELTPKLDVILQENQNDTLDDNMCSIFSSLPQTPTPQLYEALFTQPMIDWFDQAAPGSSLTPKDVSSLISLCAFHTLVKASSHNADMSPICALFIRNGTYQNDSVGDIDPYAIFEQYSHFTSLQKFYNTGPGSPLHLGPVQGVGYINELISRLTGEPVQDETQTNRTLDEEEATFPIGRDEDDEDESGVKKKRKKKVKGRKMYVDFSHDNLMIAVYAAMGLDFGVRGDMTLTPDSLNGDELGALKRSRYVSSNIVPFATEMVVERMECAIGRKGRRKREYETFVRIIINDDLQPLPFCSDKRELDNSGVFDERHREYVCTLGAFVESQAYARGNGMGDWEKCFDVE